MIFVPTYNERANAGELFRELLGLGLDADILFLDDNSPDGTGQLLDELAAGEPRLHVIHRSGKLGIGSAHQEGVAWAYDHGYSRLVTMDCDFTHNPADIPRLLACADGVDVVVGSRWLQPGSLPGWNMLRWLLTSFGHILTRILLRMPYDATGAFRLYNLARIPRSVFRHVSSRGYAFFFESLFLLIRNGFSVREIPIVLPPRTYGHSNMSLREAAHSAGRVVRLCLAALWNPDQFRAIDPPIQLDPALIDPQHWDEYWVKKRRAASVVYDIVAALYRNLIIKRQLNRFIHRHFEKGSRLLHAGCGSAQVDAAIQHSMAVTEVDISAEALALCAKNNPRASLIRQADIMNLPFPEGSFDGAYNLGVLEHFTETEIRKILDEMHRVVKTGGKVVIFWPHARATSVRVLNAIHWLLNSVLRQNVRLHPAEISLLPSRQFAEKCFHEAGFNVVGYHFGLSDFFVQAVIVATRSCC